MKKTNFQKYCSKKTPHFSLRKTSLGLVSALVAFSIGAVFNNNYAQASSSASASIKQEVESKNVTKQDTQQVTKKQTAASSPSTTASSVKKDASQKQTSPQNISNEVNSNLNLQITGQTSSPQIVDINKTNSKAAINSSITNNAKQSQKAELVLTLPKFGQTPNPDQVNAVLTGPVTTDWENNVDISYSVTPGIYLSEKDLRSQSDFSWSNVIAIMMTGDLEPNQTANIQAQLEITNLNQIQKDLTNLLAAKGSQDLLNPGLRKINVGQTLYLDGPNNTLISKSVPDAQAYYELPATQVMTNIANMLNGKTSWQARTLTINDKGQLVYSPVPATIQDALKPLSENSISYTNVDGSTGTTLYTDGTYQISLQEAFDQIKNLGYSVNILPSGNNIWSSYSYSIYPSQNGDTIGLNPGHVYLQVQPIFTTKDVTLNSTQTWQPQDNLISAQAVLTSVASMRPVQTINLLKTNGYSYVITNSNGEVVAHSDSASKSLKLAAGNYTITYSYPINSSHVVTKTAQITVTDANSVSPNPTPIIPQPNPQPMPAPKPKPEDNSNKDNTSPEPAPRPLPAQPAKQAQNAKIANKQNHRLQTNSAKSSIPLLAQGVVSTKQKVVKNAKSAEIIKTNDNHVAKTSSAKLPKTGISEDAAAILIGIASVIFGSLLFIKARKKN